jgi:hypothetical protein
MLISLGKNPDRMVDDVDDMDNAINTEWIAEEGEEVDVDVDVEGEGEGES